jgi:ethylbenzene dioxygenase beta subunit
VTDAAALTPELVLEVEQFLYREARLLDEEDYTAWLGLLTEDVHYWVPGVESRNRTDPEGTYGSERMAYFDDTLLDLTRRVKRFTSDTAWAENPPTRHFHSVGNVEVEPGETAGTLTVHSVTIVHRGRYEGFGDVLYGRREDLLRRVDGELRIARRRVVIGHSTLPSKNLNTFL